MVHGRDVRHVSLDDVEHQLKTAHRVPPSADAAGPPPAV
jgi:hypothetical protein